MSTAHAPISAADQLFDSPPPAPVAAEALTDFIAMLRSESARLGVPLLDPVRPDASFTFEARVCPLPLATLARPFDHDPAVIAVLDEAQFRRRQVVIAADAHGFASIAVSARGDRSVGRQRCRASVVGGNGIRTGWA